MKRKISWLEKLNEQEIILLSQLTLRAISRGFLGDLPTLAEAITDKELSKQYGYEDLFLQWIFA